jgi:PAS domain S-box-containing protein
VRQTRNRTSRKPVRIHRKKAPAILSRLQEYEAIIENSDAMITVFDRSYRFLVVNRAYLEYRGLRREQLVGHRVSDLLNPGVFETIVKPKLDECFAGKIVKFEIDYDYPVLGRRNLSITYLPMWVRRRVERVVCIVHDVTKVKADAVAIRDLSTRLLTVQDDERRMLARELHDGLGTYIAGLSLAVGKLRTFLDDTNPEHQDALARCRVLLADSGDEIRSISYLLRPPVLENAGLATALERLVAGLSDRSTLSIKPSIDPCIGRLPPEIELTLFRIGQEALNNIYRHSKSRSAELRLFRRSCGLVLEVRDRGKGSKRRAGSSGQFTVGISSIKERVESLGGRFTFQLAPNSGSLVRAEIPQEVIKRAD